MLKKHNKPLFFALLTPLYFLLLVLFIGLSAGSIEWLSFFLYSVLILCAAWALSRKGSLVVNTCGLLIFAAFGGLLIYSTLAQSVRTGPWTVNIYFGAGLILLGLCAYLYNLIKSKRTNQ